MDRLTEQDLDEITRMAQLRRDRARIPKSMWLLLAAATALPIVISLVLP